MGDFYVIFIKLIGNLHQTYTLSSCNIAYMFIVDIGFSHSAEPILIMRVAYTHIVSIGSAACQEPLEPMSGATPLHVRKGSKRWLEKSYETRRG